MNRKRGKSFYSLLVLVLLVGCASNTKGGSYNSYNYIVTPEHTIIITGYNGKGGNIEIPSLINRIPVTHIGNRAFARSNLTNVIIPDSVIDIGDKAFAGNQLSTINIPKRIFALRGFSENQLTSVVIPDGVTSIEDGAFILNELTSVTIPGSVTSIGDSAFMLNHLTSVTICEGVTTIGKRAFANNALTSVTIPNSVRTIGYQAFVAGGNIIFDYLLIGAGGASIPIHFGNEITKIIIGSMVSFPSGNAFMYNFEDFYSANDHRAGTYTYENEAWSFE